MLQAWSGGDAAALDRLTPIVYAELHRIARRHMADEREEHLLQPSALVNEAVVRLMEGPPGQWASPVHFYAFAARVMKQILIDFLDLDAALGELAELDARQARVV